MEDTRRSVTLTITCTPTDWEMAKKAEKKLSSVPLTKSTLALALLRLGIRAVLKK